MRLMSIHWAIVAAGALIALSAESALAKPDKKKESPAPVQPQAQKPAPAKADVSGRPANCPGKCPNCPWNSKNAAAPAAPAAKTEAGPRGQGPGHGQGFCGGRGGRGSGGGGPPWMRASSDAKAGAAEDRSPMEVFHGLLNQHEKIRRTVQEIPGGVFTVTTSGDPGIARNIKLHVAQMKARIENRQPLRRWDPLFEEIFKHSEKITMRVEEMKDGAKVIETSDDPQVAKLIRQHATRGVSEFVKDGFDRAHKASALPEGYAAPAPAKPADAAGEKADGRPRWGRMGRQGGQGGQSQ